MTLNIGENQASFDDLILFIGHFHSIYLFISWRQKQIDGRSAQVQVFKRRSSFLFRSNNAVAVVMTLFRICKTNLSFIPSLSITILARRSGDSYGLAYPFPNVLLPAVQRRLRAFYCGFRQFCRGVDNPFWYCIWNASAIELGSVVLVTLDSC